MASLKDSWKELGEELLENKRKMMSKFDELKLDFIKLKSTKQFQGSPEQVEMSFKKKIIDKFNDIYQLIGNLTTKTEFDNTI